MKNVKFSIIILFVVLTACNKGGGYKTMIIKTRGYTEVAPDMAMISVNLSCVNKNIELARNCLAEKTKSLNDLMKHFGIDQKDILTTRVNLNKDYRWVNNSNIFNGYDASVTTNVTIRNLSVMDSLYSALLSDENITLGSLTYSHSKMDSLEDVAYTNALNNANRIAGNMMAGLPEKNREIVQISNVPIQANNATYKNEFKAYEAEVSKDKSTVSLNIGNVAVEEYLYVEYRVY